MSHAILSPSAASRWLRCTPSARLEQRCPDKGSEYAREGTFAHEVAATKLLNALRHRQETSTTKIQRQSPYYTEELEEATTLYADLVMERYKQAKGNDPAAALHVEVKLDLSHYIPEGFGTSDAVIAADGRLEVIDLKYGKGVEVDATENRQMMVYALGALYANVLHDVRTVRMTIVQPRLGHVSEYEISSAALLEWGEKELKPRARIAFDGAGELEAGAHCRFCGFKGRCSALLAVATNAAKEAQAYADDPRELSPEGVARVLGIADTLTKWFDAVKEQALENALKGEEIPGYKVVEGRSVRVIQDTEKAKEALAEAGYAENEYLTTPTLMGLTALEKSIGKKATATVLAELITKPEGKPALVPIGDKRPALAPRSADSALTADDDSGIF